MSGVWYTGKWTHPFLMRERHEIEAESEQLNCLGNIIEKTLRCLMEH